MQMKSVQALWGRALELSSGVGCICSQENMSQYSRCWAFHSAKLVSLAVEPYECAVGRAFMASTSSGYRSWPRAYIQQVRCREKGTSDPLFTLTNNFNLFNLNREAMRNVGGLSFLVGQASLCQELREKEALYFGHSHLATMTRGSGQ